MITRLRIDESGVELSRRASIGATREARRDGIRQAVAPVPALDQRLAIVIRALGGIAELGRTVAVHHHLAGDHPQVEAFGFFEQGVD